MAEERDGPDTLRVPFIFVKHGDPEPREWMARHSDWVKIPAVMIPRNSPHHPANGGPYPTFNAPPVRPVVAAVPEVEERPHPGGLGAPPGTPGAGDPVGAFLRANAALEPRRVAKLAGKDSGLADARERAFLHLVRRVENEGKTDEEAYRARFGGRSDVG